MLAGSFVVIYSQLKRHWFYTTLVREKIYVDNIFIFLAYRLRAIDYYYFCEVIRRRIALFTAIYRQNHLVL